MTSKRRKSHESLSAPKARNSQELARISSWHNSRSALMIPRFEQTGNTITLAGDKIIGRMNLAKTLATSDETLAGTLINQVANATTAADGVQATNIGISTINAVAPKDGLEAMLATQMAACHDLAMKIMGRAAHETSPRQLASYVDMATKFSRTFVAQIEALSRLRNRGQQKVVVEHQHVSVQAGGQAIVGVIQDLKKTGGG